MRTKTIVVLCATLSMLAACGGDDGPGDGYTGAGDDTSGDGDGDSSGDGDGDSSGDGDGDPSGDGDGDSSGDGDPGIPIDPDNMIDNFEDGDGALIPNGGRKGYWYIFNDETDGATQAPAADEVLPEAGGAAGTDLAMHTTGSGFAVWGAGIGVDLNNEGDAMGGNGIKMIYDASAFTGIVLMAKGSGQIRASVQIEATIPLEEGGTCPGECDPHGKVLLLSDEWQQFTLPFDQLSQEGWGTAASWDASKIVGLQFKVKKDTDFDFWVDEIGFY